MDVDDDEEDEVPLRECVLARIIEEETNANADDVDEQGTRFHGRLRWHTTPNVSAGPSVGGIPATTQPFDTR